MPSERAAHSGVEKSGLSHQVHTLEIAGSNPAAATKVFFFFAHLLRKAALNGRFFCSSRARESQSLIFLENLQIGVDRRLKVVYHVLGRKTMPKIDNIGILKNWESANP